MTRSRVPRIAFVFLFIFIFIVPIGFIVMALWNNILAGLFHLSIINFWQALGIFALARILFGGFPSRPGWAGRRRGMQEMRNKWFNLSPEEKQVFKQQWKHRCGPDFNTPTPEPPAAE